MQKRDDMAQRKRGKAARSRGTRKRVAAAKKKAPRRSSAKKLEPKKSAKAKTKRIVAKVTTKLATAKSRVRPKELPIEVVKVEQVNESAPGVAVVAEVEAVRVGPAPVSAASDE
jgi:hypothetical protein